MNVRLHPGLSDWKAGYARTVLPAIESISDSLALTANAFASDIGKAHSAGMNDHIAKPIDLGILMETLRRWMI